MLCVATLCWIISFSCAYIKEVITRLPTVLFFIWGASCAGESVRCCRKNPSFIPLDVTPKNLGWLKHRNETKGPSGILQYILVVVVLTIMENVVVMILKSVWEMVWSMWNTNMIYLYPGKWFLSITVGKCSMIYLFSCPAETTTLHSRLTALVCFLLVATMSFFFPPHCRNSRSMHRKSI